MSDPGFACEACGRRFKWKPALAGRTVKCRCGSVITIPDHEPEEPAGALELAEDPAAASPARPANTKCVNCNAPLSGGGVLCVRCGTDQRTGRKQSTEMLSGAADAEPDLRDDGMSNVVSGEVRRNEDDEDGGLDAYRAGGMVALEFGLWCALLSVGMVALAVVCGVVAIFSQGMDFVLWAGGFAIASILFNLLSYVLMFGVPGEAKARWILVIAFLFSTASIAAEFFLPADWYHGVGALIGGFLGFMGTVFFLLFLKQVADFFEFAEVSEKADKVVGYFIVLSIARFAMCNLILAVIVLIYMAYALSLYVSLLIDLQRCAKYRRRHGGPIRGMIKG